MIFVRTRALKDIIHVPSPQKYDIFEANLEVVVMFTPNFIYTKLACCSIRERCIIPSKFIFSFKFSELRRAEIARGQFFSNLPACC